VSRYRKNIKDRTLIYGTDHALGFFYEIWEEYDAGEEAVQIKDRCQFFGMPISEMAEALIEFKVPAHHREALFNQNEF
jgi:hypothetical protein